MTYSNYVAVKGYQVMFLKTGGSMESPGSTTVLYSNHNHNNSVSKKS